LLVEGEEVFDAVAVAGERLRPVTAVPGAGKASWRRSAEPPLRQQGLERIPEM
jgi:hypothetical protein